MTRRSVILLGGRGFIGSALAQRLQRIGQPFYVVGRAEIGQLDALLEQAGTLVHLASSTTPGASASQPERELGNIELSMRLTDKLQKHPDVQLVFFSSGGTVYGNPSTLPVTEEAPTAPLSNHGAAKVAQEAFCHTLRARGHAVTILRPSNAYGPGQGLKSGFGLVRTMLEHARQGTTLQIWGDGDNVRDYIYIDDIVDATLRLIQAPENAGVYNLGCGVGHSVNQVRALVEKVTGLPVNAVYAAARGIDVRSVVLCRKRLESQCGWQPLTTLEIGIAKTWHWSQTQ
ncbi:MAG: NAD-dependent epimerase/dehydratase family protein [Rhodoferax sp.]|nr:NAD-dependent epimerase/dehydratase family protein [Rhodoferax sp.]